MSLKESDLLKKFNIVSRYSEHTPETVRRPWLGDMAKSLFENTTHVYFGEPHIGGNAVKAYEMFAQNPELFTEAAKAGVKHFAIEFPNQLQKFVDEYAEGKTTREEFRKRVFENRFSGFVLPWATGDGRKAFESNFVQAIDNALQAGMKVHFSDVNIAAMLVPPPRELTDLQMTLLKMHRAEKSKLSGEEYKQQYLATLPEEERLKYEKLQADYMLDVYKARLDDTDLYFHLRGAIPRGEKILGVAGLGHLDNSMHDGNSIVEWFRTSGESVTVIEVYDSRNTQQFVTELQKDVRGLKNRDLPDYTIILGEDKLLDKAMKDADPKGLKPPSPPPALAA